MSGAIGFYFISGVMLGAEYTEDEEEHTIILDLFILRILLTFFKE